MEAEEKIAADGRQRPGGAGRGTR
ncbi:BnaA02g26870D [Brassica napus]|uniref:BnaA02g26870D protein n=1 Tax=Brassica napus TaxID=3708 RepID=A0A078HUC6_BRANA|nr:BnaA02g26870D [Brassica napus]